LSRVSWSLRGVAVDLVALVAFCACAVPPRPIGFDPEAAQPATTDGLYRLRATRVAGVFARPGASLSGYDRILLDPVTVSYKEKPRPASKESRPRGNFALNDIQLERLKQMYRASLERELLKGGVFTTASDVGPGVLRLSSHIVNLVVNAPPFRGGERDFVFDAGALTLIVDVADSQSQESLLRMIDRRAIRPGYTDLSGVYETGPVTNAGALSDVFYDWALVVRDWIDLLRESPVPPAPAASDPD